MDGEEDERELSKLKIRRKKDMRKNREKKELLNGSCGKKTGILLSRLLKRKEKKR